MKSQDSRVVLFIAFVLILVCASATMLAVSNNPESANIITALTAVVGAVAIWFEMKRSKDMAEGQFISSLNQDFLGNEDIKRLYEKLVAGSEILEEDRVKIVEYMTFFETVFLLLDRGVLALDLTDDLFYYRFQVAVNNKDIQSMELLPDAQYYVNIYTLDNMLYKVADVYEEEVSVLIEGLVNLLEPIMTVVLGLIVGFIVIALFMPLVKLLNELS